MSEPQCYFGVQLDTMPQVRVCWTSGTVKLTDLEEDIQEILLWRVRSVRTGLLGHEGELTICFHHQQFFGNVFEKRA